MENSSYVPRSLRLAADRLSSFSRNRVMLMPTGSSNSGPGQIISVVLPSSSVLDLHSYCMRARVKTNAAINGSDRVHFKLPGDSASLIHRSEVSFNGTVVSHGCNEFNTVHRVKKISSCSRDRDLSTDMLLQHSSLRDDEAIDDLTLIFPFSHFPRIFGESSCRCLDTAGL